MTTLDDLMRMPPGPDQAARERALLPLLNELTAHHRAHCPPYRRIADLTAPGGGTARRLADIPYLPAALFKHRRLRSVAAGDIRVTVTSSGTTGAQRSAVELDAAAARLSARALACTFGNLTQNRRLPLLVIDSETALADPASVGARAAAILGLMPFGCDIHFALDDNMRPDWARIENFFAAHAQEPVLIFGFTFLVWRHLAPYLEHCPRDLSQALLLHSGGWKKMRDEAVDNAAFRQKFSAIGRVVNFYGMAELPGTVFVEKNDGWLEPPPFATFLIRDSVTFAPLPPGQPGLVQILTVLPRSYPGHSLLTEDIGVGMESDSGRLLRLMGRAPRAEMRGCSDVMELAA